LTHKAAKIVTTLTTHPIENIIIPRYDPKDAVHKLLAKLSRTAHTAAANGEAKALADAETAINQNVDSLW
jgi:hypothetical protein